MKISFARWQQGAGFVVPRTTACYLCRGAYVFLGFCVSVCMSACKISQKVVNGFGREILGEVERWRGD